ncbi:MAG TPA: hypothetical protein VN950_17025 [Terriglobales bacterium]|nr:hypothetical protein [Terriglobales bacterium]
MILKSMHWHDEAILGEHALQAAWRVFDTEDCTRGEKRTSPVIAAVIFDNEIKLRDPMEVITTTEPNKKAKV